MQICWQFFKGGVLLVIPILIWIYSVESDNSIILLFLFSIVLILSLAQKNNVILFNPIIKFLSDISLEIYLSHMVIYRILEKMGFLYVMGDGVLSYIITVVLVFSGTVLFSVIVRKGIESLENFLKNYLRR